MYNFIHVCVDSMLGFYQILHTGPLSLSGYAGWLTQFSDPNDSNASLSSVSASCELVSTINIEHWNIENWKCYIFGVKL